MSSTLKPASMLRVGHVSKKVHGKQYVVKSKSGKKAASAPKSTHYWATAKPEDIKCSKYLSGKIKKLTHESKTKKASRIKTHNQAIAVAYSMTKKKYPKCELTKQRA
jgi:hypothetical protein